MSNLPKAGSNAPKVPVTWAETTRDIIIHSMNTGYFFLIVILGIFVFLSLLAFLVLQVEAFPMVRKAFVDAFGSTWLSWSSSGVLGLSCTWMRFHNRKKYKALQADHEDLAKDVEDLKKKLRKNK